MVTSDMNNKVNEDVNVNDWGNVEARYTTTNIDVGFFKKTQRQMTLRDGDTFYNVNLDDNTATKMNLKETQEKLMKGFNAQNMSFEEAKKKFGGIDKGTGMHLGKKCHIVEFTKMNSEV